MNFLHSFVPPALEMLYREYFTRVTPADRETIISAKTPVFFVAGWQASSRCWLPFKRFLEQHGFAVFLPSNRHCRQKMPELVQDFLQSFRALPVQRVQIVAHSLGGLIVLAALREAPEIGEKIERIILLGTPYRGALIGWLVFWANAWKYLRFQSAWRKLVRETDPQILAKIHALSAQYDELVVPRSYLPGAKENAVVPVLGHSSLVFHEKSWQEVLRRLK